MAEFLKTTETFRQGSFTLPQKFYTSPEVFNLEKEKIFNNDWQCVGHVSKIPATGNYFLHNQLDESVIVLRNKNGGVSSFYNVCRHKGTEILQSDGCGSEKKSIQCSYHGWTYDLDGKLTGAPSMEDVKEFKTEDYPLKRAPVNVWNGFIFVNLSLETPTPFEEKYNGLVGKFKDWNLDKLKPFKSDKFIGTITYEVEANWKLMLENFNECYHCATLHPELNKILDNKSGYNDLTQGTALGGFMELLPEKESVTLSGKKCALPIRELNANEAKRGYYYSVMPNLLLNVHSDYVAYHIATPVSPNKTKIVTEWLFNPESFGRPGFNPMDAVEFWDKTNMQDWGVCERGQRGISSHSYEPGRYSDREALLAEFDRHYLEIMKNE